MPIKAKPIALLTVSYDRLQLVVGNIPTYGTMNGIQISFKLD